MRTLAAGAVILVTLVASAAAASPTPKALVLRLSDLPSGFTVQRTHAHASAADAARDGGSIAELRRWGFVRSYLVQFAGQPLHMFTGPVTVVSAAAVFRTGPGARAANAASRTVDLAEGFARVRVTAALGADAWAYTYVERRDEGTIRVYAVGWRRGVVQAYVAANGADGVVTPGQLFALAKKQDRYLTRAMLPTV